MASLAEAVVGARVVGGGAAASSTPKELAPVPAKLAEWAAQWSHDDRSRNWPQHEDLTISLVAWERWMRNRGLSANSVEICLQGLRYFVTLFSVELPLKSEMDIAGVLAFAYKNNLAASIVDLPILHKQYTWSIKIATAVKKFCEYVNIECGRENWLETARCVRQLFLETVEPLLKVVKRRAPDTWPSTKYK